MNPRSLGVCLSVGLTACAGSSTDGVLPDGCLPGDSPTLDVGEGAASFEPRADGDPVELVHGAQGGFHVVIALDGQFLDVSEDSRAPAVLTATIDAVPTAVSNTYLVFRCNPDTGTLQSFGTVLVFTPTEDQLQGVPAPEFLNGKSAQIHAEVTDRAGHVAIADRTVLIHDPLLEAAP